MNRHFALGALIFLSLGCLLRIIYLQQLKRTPFGSHPIGDSASYAARAEEIANGDVWGGRPFFLASPAYPYFLSLFRSGKALRLWPALVVQSLLGLCSAVVLGLSARKLWDDWAGLVATGLALTYGPFLFFEGELLATVWVVFFVSLFLFATIGWRERTPSWWVGTPLMLGVLFRPTLLAAAIGMGLYVFWKRRQENGLKDRLKFLVYFSLPGLLAFSLLTWRNWKVSHDFIPAASSAGINFYLGNHADATGSYDAPETWGAHLEENSTRVAEEALGRPLKPSEVSRYWFGKGLTFAKEHPRDWLVVTYRKVLLLFNRYEVPNHYDYLAFHDFVPILRMPLLEFGLVAPLAFTSLCLVKVRRESGFAWVFLAIQMLTIVPFFVTARYRMPAIPALILLASGTLRSLPALVKDRSSRIGIQAGGLFLLSAACVNLPRVPGADPAGMKVRLGQLFLQEGDLAQAEEAFLEGTRSNPESLSAWQGAALAAYYAGRPKEGLERFEKALALHPASSSVCVGAARCLEALGQIEEAKTYLEKALESSPEDTALRWNLWKLQLKSGEPEQLLLKAEAAWKSDPSDGDALRALVACLSLLGREEEALERLEKGSPFHSEDPDLLMDWARLLMDLGRIEEAEEKALKVSKVHPSRGDAYNLLGVIQGQRGQWDQAILLFEKALRRRPGDPGASNNLKRARKLKRETSPPPRDP